MCKPPQKPFSPFIYTYDAKGNINSVTDQTRTLRVVVDAEHNVVKEITYDTYGNILNDSNPNFTVPFGFAGGLHDRDTNLVHFGYREYDPFTAKWTTKDPIDFSGGDTNLYGYVLNDPVNFVDPLGLYCENDPINKRAFGDPDNKPWDKFKNSPLYKMLKGAYKGFRLGMRVAGPPGGIVGPGFGMINEMQKTNGK
ncbi:RHS repeat-associated core domain-containing protein [Sulfurimonas lithotrophica]|uniref:RHS repeat-associated core domain-containing protein n=1 Tax=Sulfurimonas lithotrophica TaxID=2590022 RepID=A0A5P8NZE1_9BACT|nr:RHS repeat-associated core domain-containing protein [Sulfurimonas lithotrophica]QFR48812.1 RHS repeat-associated core domain-containing protein [Sulfurimonas lithotrophica]